jgi:hypothetical protein
MTMVRLTSFTRAAVAAALALSFAQAGAADAVAVATLSEVQGVALINQGSDFVTAKPGMALRQGDRLMAMEGGTAVLTYADGCKFNVADNQVFTVGSANSCTAGTLSQRPVGPYVAAAPAIGAGAMAGLAAAGAVATVVVVGAASSSGSDDNDNPPAVPPTTPVSP